MSKNFIRKFINQIELFNYKVCAVFINHKTKKQTADKTYDSAELVDCFSCFFRQFEYPENQEREKYKKTKNYKNGFYDLENTSKKQE